MVTVSHITSVARPRPFNSPEYSKSFPFQVCDHSDYAKSKNIIYSGVSRISGRKCGLCNKNAGALYFSEIASYLKELLKLNSCQELVVFGTAFGEVHFDKFIKKHEGTTMRHTSKSSCFLSFVLSDDLIRKGNTDPKKTQFDSAYVNAPIISPNGIDILIPVDSKRLPYSSMRRNTKLFKQHGASILFPHIKRIMWQDAKIFYPHLNGGFSLGLNNYKEYIEYFDQTITKSSACVGFMGMPKHTNCVGENACTNEVIKLQHHCNTVVNANNSGKRAGSVTDSSNSLLEQCNFLHIGRTN